MTTRQQEKSRQTKDELMASAMELFGAKGYFATSVSQITRRAGYAKASFYRHWPGKDELMLEIIEHKLASYRRARDKRMAQASSLPEAMEIIWDFLESIDTDKNWSRAFLEFTLHASRHPELKRRLHEPGQRLSNKVFADLVRPHAGPDAPLEKMGALNTALFEGFLIQTVLDTGVLSREDVKHAAMALVLSKAGE